MKQLPGFSYDARRKRATFDGYVIGTGGKIRRRKTVENVTRAQALSAWKEFRDDLESGRAVEGPLTLRQFVKRYYHLICASHAPATKKAQEVIMKNHLLRYFGDDELTTITSIRVIDFMADMRSRNCSAHYINDAVRVLKMLLRQAYEREVIAEYPIRKRIPKEKEVPLRLELKPDERARFFAAFTDEAAFLRYLDENRQLGPVKSSQHFGLSRRFGGGMRGDSDAALAYFERFRELREFFIVATETGLRMWSDLRNLRWSSIDLTAGFIRVLMQKTQHEAEIPISSACREALRICRTRPAVASVCVFVDEDGRQYTPERLRRAFRLAKELAGITRRFRPHDLRHTFGCRLADQNISLQKIAKALGHTTTRMAERYARPSTEAMREITRALDSDPLLPVISTASAADTNPTFTMPPSLADARSGQR
ncbi:MAG TPA: site-specific integrase [Thermoanaerobaculia bacterium]|jgi:integrase